MSRDQECQEKKKKELKDVEKAKLEEPEEDEPILEEDEYNPEGFDPYPKDPKEVFASCCTIESGPAAYSKAHTLLLTAPPLRMIRCCLTSLDTFIVLIIENNQQDTFGGDWS